MNGLCSKQQAASGKRQAASSKQQAASSSKQQAQQAASDGETDLDGYSETLGDEHPVFRLYIDCIRI
jgi:hypothetical protein